ncbi:hypothetical protein VW35_19490 [Devosia soli]|uniref:O-antigen ligase-related domain-containing protein n=1 Tax=Devosia soli TaxID=361041 RepID=A0A0F5L144_9HYPH|nr:hypothetical protein VW35_19490 [Devosia soli]
MNNAIGIFAVLIVALSPVPFGSNRPFFWTLWGMLIGLTGLVYFLQATRSFDGLRIPLGRIRIPAVLWLLTALWLVVQVLPIGSFSVVLPNGQAVESATISTAPGATLLMLVRIVSYGLFFVLALEAGARESRAKTMLTAIFWIIVAHAGFSLLQLTQFGDTILGLPKIAYMGVATGTFINRNSFATFLAMGLSVGIALVPGILSAKLARNQSAMDKVLVAFLYAGGLFVITIALLATESRMGLFAGAVGAFVVLLLILKQHERWKILIPAAIVLAVALGLAAIWTFGQGTIERALTLEGSTEGRMALYEQVWNQTMDRPLIGFGGGAFSLYFPAYFGPPLNLNNFWDKAHSTYLALFSELGLVGGALPILAVAVIFGRVVWSQVSSERLSPARLAAVGAILTCAMHSLVDFSLEIQANALLFAVLVALGLAGSIKLQEKR